jgi:hypothetical protein
MQVAQYCPVAVEIQSQAPVARLQDPFPLHIESLQSKGVVGINSYES